MAEPSDFRLINFVVQFGLLVSLTISTNFLTWLGVPYTAEGGMVVQKIHPANWLIYGAFAVFIFDGFQPQWRGKRRSIPTAPELKLAISTFTLAALYGLLFTGSGNIIVLLDTFGPAVILAIIISETGIDQRRKILRLLRILLFSNAIIAIIETVMRHSVMPLYLNGIPFLPPGDEFRPTALYDHPLTGAVLSLIGLLLPPPSRWERIYTGVMMLALVAFSGRAALLAAFVAWPNVWSIGNDRTNFGKKENLFVGLVPAVGALGVMLAICAIALVGGLGMRLIGHSGWDASAAARVSDWQIFTTLDIEQVLFGCPRAAVIGHLEELRLQTGVGVIENFWLVMLLNLGVFGFPLFFVGLLALLTWCWRTTNWRGRIMLVAVMLVASASNSLGRKSVVLTVLVAASISLHSIAPDGTNRKSNSWYGSQ